LLGSKLSEHLWKSFSTHK